MAITYEPYVKTGDNTYEEIKFPYNVLADTPDLSVYVTKSGAETISGVKTFTSAPKMDTLENSRGNAVYHFNGNCAYFGQTTFPICLRGSEARPKYLQSGEANATPIALYNDLLNYVPAQSGDGTYYSQVENENGEVALRTFKNGDTDDTASVRVKKDGTVVLQGTANRPKYQKGGDSAVELALTSDVPSMDNFVTLGTSQKITGQKTFDGESKFTYEQYTGNLSGVDVAEGVGKSAIFARGALVQAITGQIIAPNKAVSNASYSYNSEANKIKFQYISTASAAAPTLTDMAVISPDGMTVGGKKVATTDQIPSTSNFVTTNTDQSIGGNKTFSNNVKAPNFNSRFALQSVPYGTAIGSNANLNTTTYLKVGNYYCGSDATTQTLTNCPTTHAFMMTVYSPLTTNIDNETTGTWVYRVRKLMTYQCEEFIQYVNSGSTAGTFTYGSWHQIAHKGDIPTVNNGTLTIQKNGSNVATFTANQSSAATANITVPTKTSELTNDSNFIKNKASNSYGISILGGTDTVRGSIEIGDGARTNGAAYSTVVGEDATSTYQSVAVGSSASASEKYSVAIGYGASTMEYGVALGCDSASKYEDSVSLGYSTEGPSTAPSTRVGCGSYTSTGRGLMLGVYSTGYTYMNSAGSSWSSASDIRDKTDIKTIDHALDFITKLKPITYVMNEREKYLIREMGENGKEGKPILDENGKQQYDKEAHARGDKKKHRRFAGLSAQDTYQAMLDCYENDTNYAQIVDNNKFDHPDDEYIEQYSMSYERLVPFLIKAVQEQQTQIDTLKSELEKLKS